MNIDTALERIGRARAAAILRTAYASAVAPAMEAAVEGGFRVIEFTLNTPGALDQIAAFSEREELLVGAGTVLSLEDLRSASAAGAQFIVSPVADPEIIRACNEQDLLVIPGAFTPAEMFAAHKAGARLIKLFPAPPDGVAYLKACLGPLPFLKLFPTSGVTAENARTYLEAGAFGVGFVNCLFQPDDLAANRFDRVRARARDLVALT